MNTIMLISMIALMTIERAFALADSPPVQGRSSPAKEMLRVKFPSFRFGSEIIGNFERNGSFQMLRSGKPERGCLNLAWYEKARQTRALADSLGYCATGLQLDPQARLLGYEQTVGLV